jgi:hypothetical protein
MKNILARRSKLRYEVLIELYLHELFFSEKSAIFADSRRVVTVCWQFIFSRYAAGDPVS